MENKHTLESLLDKRKNVFSQNGEDGLISELVSRLPLNKWFVEFGAWDGKHYSNTYNLINTTNDWKGIYIECDMNKYKDLLITCDSHRNRLYPVCAKIDESENKLDTLLQKFDMLPSDFDILSIDVDSNDYQLWKSVEKYRPKIVIVEINSEFKPGVNKIHDGTEPTGTSFTPMVELGKQKGYSLLAHVGNLIFIDSKYDHLFPEMIDDKDSLYMPHHSYNWFVHDKVQVRAYIQYMKALGRW